MNEQPNTPPPRDYYCTKENFEKFERFFTSALANINMTVLAAESGFKASTLRVMARSALNYGIKELGLAELANLSINKAKSGKETVGILISRRAKRSIMGHEVIPLWRAEFQGWVKLVESETYEAPAHLAEADKIWLRDYCHKHELYLAIGENDQGFRVVR